MLKLTVSKRNDALFHTIQEAINAVPYETPAKITVEEGIYRERLFSDKSDLTLVGEGDVVITASISAREIMDDGFKRGTFRSFTAFFSGKKSKLENLTIENSAGPGKVAGQALALYLDVDHAEVENVKLLSHQDTLFLAPLPMQEREERGLLGPRCFADRKLNTVIFSHCHIEGGVDFIFGGADALFEQCEIVSVEGGFVTAPSGYKDGRGFVFNECVFSSSCNSPEPVFLMRPWRPEGKTTVISCNIGDHVDPDLWCAWPGRDDEKLLATFSTCDNEGAEGKDVTRLGRKEAEELIASFR